MQELLPWIRLTKTGASARRLNRLLDLFGSPEALFAASTAEVVSAAGCSAAVAQKLLDPAYKASDRDLRLMEQLQVRLLPRIDPDYPALLREISDPPPALYVRGTVKPSDSRAVALVGSRRVTEYGKRVAAELARGLAEAGYTVVSGLARGTDTAAHHAAVKAGGRTLACLGCGVDVAYPAENRALAESITQSGALLSEYPMMAPPDAWHFPSRNRIISGLSLGVVVVEAPRGSGALITADCATDQNRDVFAVPGSIHNPGSYGPHGLIRDGARLVESVADILSELGAPTAPLQPTLDLEPQAQPAVKLSADESCLFALLTSESQPIDDLILESGLPASRVGAALLTLEIKGLACRRPGNLFTRAA